MLYGIYHNRLYDIAILFTHNLNRLPQNNHTNQPTREKVTKYNVKHENKMEKVTHSLLYYKRWNDIYATKCFLTDLPYCALVTSTEEEKGESEKRGSII